MTIVTAVLLGLIYPLAITGIAQVVFPGAADGSLVKANGRGGRLEPHRAGLHRREVLPAATLGGRRRLRRHGSSFSNLGADEPGARRPRHRRRVKADDRGESRASRSGAVPVDMVTTSASGLDPDITVANARAQAPRVAAARGMSLSAVLRAGRRAHRGAARSASSASRASTCCELNLALDAAQGASP